MGPSVNLGYLSLSPCPRDWAAGGPLPGISIRMGHPQGAQGATQGVALPSSLGRASGRAERAGGCGTSLIRVTFFLLPVNRSWPKSCCLLLSLALGEFEKVVFGSHVHGRERWLTVWVPTLFFITKERSEHL